MLIKRLIFFHHKQPVCPITDRQPAMRDNGDDYGQ